MHKIKAIIERIDDELCDARHYAEEYLEKKAKDNSTLASRFKEMSMDELKHATYLHEMVVDEIEILGKVYTPPQNMLDMWEHSHKEYLEKVTFIKMMLSM